MSENYVIFIEQPLKMNLWKFITAKVLGKSFLEAISWEPEHSTRFHVVNKLTGQVRLLGSLPHGSFFFSGQCLAFATIGLPAEELPSSQVC